MINFHGPRTFDSTARDADQCLGVEWLLGGGDSCEPAHVSDSSRRISSYMRAWCRNLSRQPDRMCNQIRYASNDHSSNTVEGKTYKVCFPGNIINVQGPRGTRLQCTRRCPMVGRSSLHGIQCLSSRERFTCLEHRGGKNIQGVCFRKMDQ